MAGTRFVLSLCVAILTLCAAPSPSHASLPALVASPPGPPAPQHAVRTVLILRLADDLDSSALAVALSAELASFKHTAKPPAPTAPSAHPTSSAPAPAPRQPNSTNPPRPDFIIIELRGRAWRADAVLAVAKALSTRNAVPWAVWLHAEGATPDAQSNTPPAAPGASSTASSSDSASVGAGQLILALLADHALISPATRITSDPADRLDAAITDSPDARAAAGALPRALRTALARRACDPGLLDALLSPREPLWARLPDDGSPPTLFSDRPPRDAAARSFPIVQRPALFGLFRLDIDARAALSLGLCDALARDQDSALRKLGLRPRTVITRTITNPLPVIRDRACAAMEDVRLGLVPIASALPFLEKLQSPGLRESLVDGATRQLDRINALSARLDDAERLARAYPDLLRTTPPGRADVSQLPSKLPAAWRSDIASYRRQLNDLRARACKLLEVRSDQGLP